MDETLCETVRRELVDSMGVDRCLSESTRAHLESCMPCSATRKLLLSLSPARSDCGETNTEASVARAFDEADRISANRRRMRENVAFLVAAIAVFTTISTGGFLGFRDVLLAIQLVGGSLLGFLVLPILRSQAPIYKEAVR